MSTRKKSTGFVGLVGAPRVIAIAAGFRAGCKKYWGEGTTRQEAFAAWKEARDSQAWNK